MSEEEKLAFLTREVTEKLELLHQRLQKRKIPTGDLFQRIREALK